MDDNDDDGDDDDDGIIAWFVYLCTRFLTLRPAYLLAVQEDQKEGMAAFAGKRKPEWKHK